MELLRGIVLKILFVSAFLTFTVMVVHNVCEIIVVSQAREQLKKDAYILGSILEEENCLSTDLGGESRFKYYVDSVLRSSETDTFKYDIEVSSTGSITNNRELGGDSWSGVDNDRSPIKIDEEFTSYVSCPQRGEVVRATLTMNVYTPSIMSMFVDEDDPYAANNSRMKKTISQEVEVLGMKFYKGKAGS